MYIIIQFRTTSSIRLFGSKEKMLMASCLKPFQFMLRLLYIWNTNKFYLTNQNQLCRQLLCFNNRLAQIYILCVGQRSKKPLTSQVALSCMAPIWEYPWKIGHYFLKIEQYAMTGVRSTVIFILFNKYEGLTSLGSYGASN